MDELTQTKAKAIEQQQQIDKCLDDQVVGLTANREGIIHKLNKVSHSFLNFVPPQDLPVADIGAGIGLATLMALKKGRKVISCDHEPRHIEAMEKNIPSPLKYNMRTILATFPYETNFMQNSLGAVLLSYVLNFLDGEAIAMAIDKINHWLVPGGKVFITNFSPFSAFCQHLQEHYQQRRAELQEWPGLISNLQDNNPNPELFDHHPDKQHFLEPSILNTLFVNAGFHIEKSELGSCEAYKLPKLYSLNGQECVGFIARKP